MISISHSHILKKKRKSAFNTKNYINFILINFRSMKNIAFFLLLFSSQLTFSQIKNGNFESWDTLYQGTYTQTLATDFGVLNPNCGKLSGWTQDYDFGISQTTDSYSGSYSVILHNWYSYAYQSIEYNDSIGFSPQYLHGYFKYITGDSTGLSNGLANVTLTHFNGTSNDTVASGTFTFDSTVSFTPFQISLNYISAALPDSIHILITNANTICIGSNVCNLLYLDNLSLSNNPLSIENQKSKEELFSVYPNPVQNELFIENKSNKLVEFYLFDSTGKIVFNSSYINENNILIFTKFSDGFYFYKIFLNKNIMKIGKIIKN